MKRKCDKCGLLFKAEGDICPQCGNDIAAQEAEKALNAEKRQTKKLLIALGIVIVVAAAVFLIVNPEILQQLGK